MSKLYDVLHAALARRVQTLPSEANASVMVQFAAGDWAAIQEALAEGPGDGDVAKLEATIATMGESITSLSTTVAAKDTEIAALHQQIEAAVALQKQEAAALSPHDQGLA